MPNIQSILKTIFIELGLTEARHAELIDKFEILVSKLFLTLLFDQHLKVEESELLLINFELCKKNGNEDYIDFVDELLPLSVIDNYLNIASVVVLKQYIETLLEHNFITKDKVKAILQ